MFRVPGHSKPMNAQALATLNRGRTNRGLRPFKGRAASSRGRGRSAAT